ncbi:MAG: ATP-binding protein [Clostridia bacterium]|nr:ATP-binding protein [Clostridia bacterium]
MKSYIKTTYFISFLVVTVTIVTVSLALFANMQIANTKRNLKSLAQTVKISKIPIGTDYDVFAKNLAEADGSLRVTIINSDGIVLGDSYADKNKMQNHGNRREVIQALEAGAGEDIRKSETVGLKTVYSAVKLDDGVVLRLAYPLSGVFDYLKNIMPLIIVLCIAILILINIFAKRFSDKLLYPLLRIHEMLEGKIGESDKVRYSFPETESILSNIDYLIKKLNYDFEEIIKTQKMRTDFVANVSHELKSPLTSIKGFAELMYSGMILSEDKKKDYLKRIVKESDRLLDIINDIINLSEVESKKAENVVRENINLKNVVLDVFKALEMLAESKKITLSVSGEASVFANLKEIWEMVYNLVDNAIKYGTDSGYVKILLKQTDGISVIEVKDNGIGIPKEHINRVFERFYRVDKSHSRKSGGTGLGLSIVKNVAVKYGGNVAVKSEEGKGSTFVIKFPNSL